MGGFSRSITAFFVVAIIYIFGMSGVSMAGGEPLLTWVSGANTINQTGVYGSKGVAHANNIPGSRDRSISWADSNDNLWLFGGRGYGIAGSLGELSDLWQYDGNDWTWVSGPNTINQAGVYGSKGVASAGNIPGSRQNSISWADSSGDFWLFGGRGRDGAGTFDHLNDLWKFDGNDWTWISGPDIGFQVSVYGSKGVADGNNIPGARQWSISWTDSNDNLWLFGGQGYDTWGSLGKLSDLWKFDGNDWTWVSGPNTVENPGVYGSKGVADANNIPGARQGSISWTDSNDNLWLFGGWGRDGSNNGGYLNDLWKFDGTNWTWVSGSNTGNQAGVYGNEGVADANNIPGSRERSISWTDSSGNLWLFAGWGLDSTGSGGLLNDLWKFDGTNWTWVSGANTIDSNGVYGSKGLADANNIPGSRESSISWADSNGDLWLFGGDLGINLRINDLWRIQVPTNVSVPVASSGPPLTWVSGPNTINQAGVYGSKGFADANNIPGARYNSISWTGSGDNFWLFGGWGHDSTGSPGYLSDLWQYDGDDWTWVSGENTVNQTGVYGSKGLADVNNIPGARYSSISWTDSNGDFWLFGGWGRDSTGSGGHLNDLWRYDGTNWTWVSGENTINQAGVYGSIGDANTDNIPGARRGSISWTDSNDNLWLFGGWVGGGGRFNDLWRYDGTNWTWVSGPTTGNQTGVYGSKGLADANNIPGARLDSISWTDSNDNLWLFGGWGNGGHLNDLWRYDGTNWTWVSGPNTMNQTGVYGSKGIADANNIPGSRGRSISWTSSNGDFWLFGGYSGAGQLNDLWKYDGTNWTWVSGPNTVSQAGVYGIKGLADANNIPSSRGRSISWTDSNGDLWLFGGDIVVDELLNDLWKIQIHTIKYSGGSGSSADPYLISTADDMDEIGTTPTDWGANFLQIADINMAVFTGTEFNIIGVNSTMPFTGVFDGNGHTISNFTYSFAVTTGSGIFGHVNDVNAIIRDVALIDPNVDASAIYYAGSLVGYIENGSIIDCYSVGGNISGGSFIGGLVGYSNGSILNSYATTTVSGISNIAGLVGYNSGTIANCYATGSVISNAIAAGGLAGYNSGSISNCYATGSVSANLYAAGGLVGENDSGSISNCYAGGSVFAPSNVGALVGEDSSGTYIKSFFDSTANPGVSGIGNTTDPNVIGETTANMQTESTFTDAGWDFLEETTNGTNDLWRMCADAVSYPLLSWDFNKTDFDCPDGVDFIDFAMLSLAWYSQPGDGNWNAICDISEPNDNIIDELDLKVFTDDWLIGK